MEYTKIPNISEKVSRIGLGTWSMSGSLWGGSDEKEAIQTIRDAIEQGINFIDTAPAYGKGASERLVGKAIKDCRCKVIIATKCGLNQETDNVFRDSSPRYIFKEIQDSLTRLNVDYVDIYQIHWPDPTTPIAETAAAMKELLDECKIRAIGVSNYTVEQMEEFRKVAPIHTCQPPFNLFEREQEASVIQYCKDHDIAIIGYSGLCRGLLSGKMSKNREFKGDDLRKGMDPKFKEPHFSEYLACVNELKNWFKMKYNKAFVALPIRWVLDRCVNITLWGARKPEQLDDVKDVFGFNLTEQDFKDIDKIIAKTVKHPVGPDFMAPPVREPSKQSRVTSS